jgi:excisionase family DNA binding protein
MQTLNDPLRLVSLQYAADLLGVCVRTVYRLIDEGELPRPFKVRGCSRLPLAAVNAYLEKLGVAVS